MAWVTSAAGQAPGCLTALTLGEACISGQRPADINIMLTWLSRRAACRVPQITQFYGAFHDPHQIFLVMEYCAGGDLLERLKKENRAMAERRVIAEVAVPVLRTLQHMHSHAIIHRCGGSPDMQSCQPCCAA